MKRASLCIAVLLTTLGFLTPTRGFHPTAETLCWAVETYALPPQKTEAMPATPGMQGSQRAPGMQGSQATPGVQGSQMTPGTQGYQTTPGVQGYQMAPGMQGSQMTPGVQGYQTTPGMQGSQMTPATQGSQAAPGVPGSPDTTVLIPPPRSAHPIVWIVHGFQGQEQDFTKEFIILRQIYQLSLDVPCITWRWNAPAAKFYDIRDKWKKALKDQLVAAENLFQDIRKMQVEDQQRLILAGHSLGGGVVIHALAKCQQENIKIDHFILMGAAIANDDPDIALALRATTRRSYSLVNMSDYALGAYRIMEYTPALGTGYAFLADETKLCELVFEGMEDSHAAADYLENFKKCVEKNQYKTVEILVPQDWRHVADTTSAEAEKETQSMFKEKGMPNGIFTFAIPWRDIDEMDGWVLQKRNVIPNPYYRILSPDKRTMAWGWSKRMTMAFEKVKAQLARNGHSPNTDALAGYAPMAPNAASGVSQPQLSGWPGWNTLDAYYGWKLQKSSSSNRCRILDPNERQTAEGDEETLRRAFERVKTVVGNPANGSSTKLAPVTNAYPNFPTGNAPETSSTATGTSRPTATRQAPVGTAENSAGTGTSQPKSSTGWFGWKTLDVYYGWKLQKGNSSNRCRILDPYGRQTAEGDEETLRRVFEQQKMTGGKPVNAPPAQTTYAPNAYSNTPASHTPASPVPTTSNAATSTSQPKSTGWPAWKTLDSYKGWRLQKGSFSSKCRILDPDGRQTAEGDEETLRRTFNQMKAVSGSGF